MFHITKKKQIEEAVWFLFGLMCGKINFDDCGDMPYYYNRARASVTSNLHLNQISVQCIGANQEDKTRSASTLLNATASSKPNRIPLCELNVSNIFNTTQSDDLNESSTIYFHFIFFLLIWHVFVDF